MGSGLGYLAEGAERGERFPTANISVVDLISPVDKGAIYCGSCYIGSKVPLGCWWASAGGSCGWGRMMGRVEGLHLRRGC